ncbi:methylated-DNA-protein-cysteine methyltransferase related protein [Paraglaciecola mesophila KMM 241]|uniref:Methylated-DNA-protein-cysteine methyltransferase related protein n=1 Tax=Paraglaciecola mesophila KMM 241 TaxID=1128912 RepID=K6YS38_9ALTE|nr:MGMT family protein [Paraglaciecola mesophila]GAC26776.1 methylated-DNA-protein-cysteine methyltransferase related protein [Paraglaciecola mesophila KMM 241]
MSHNPHYKQIWQTVCAIPAGKVASYGQIADLAGLPGRARLVGKSLGYIPSDMNVPWYRVLRSSGQLAFPKGSEQAMKQTGLLQDENVAVLSHRVKLASFQWQPTLEEMLWKLQQ